MFEFDLPPSIDDLETTAAPFEPVGVGDEKPESDPVVAEAEPRVAVASDHKPPGKRTRRKPPARAPPNRRRKRARRLLPLVRDAYSILEFCRAHSISRATYYILRARGQGPDEARVLGRVVITREAAKRWRERITRAARKQGAKVINPDC